MYTSGGQGNKDANKTSQRPVSVFGNAKNNIEGSLKMFNVSGE
jgi:hypothetical protein